MSNNLNCGNQQPPSYSGVTINITNPALNIPPNVYMPHGEGCTCYDPNSAKETGVGVNIAPYSQYYYQATPQGGINVVPNSQYPYTNAPQGVNTMPSAQYSYAMVPQEISTVPSQQYSYATVPQGINNMPGAQYPYAATPQIVNTIPGGQYSYPTMPQGNIINSQTNPTPINSYETNPDQQYINKGSYLEPIRGDYNSGTQNINTTNIYQTLPSDKQELPTTYPQQYYINSYENPVKNTPNTDFNNGVGANGIQNTEEEVNTDTSKEIIAELDERNYEEKELEKNSKKTKIIALTNEYIMSLENYLNNPNTDIRLMAAKEVLTRLDEDRNRYDDAALNALLNKMLQDPSKLIRIAAMSAFSSELASGNEYTVQLLNQIQQNPESDPEDVLEASQILLKRAATVETKYISTNNQQQQQKANEE